MQRETRAVEVFAVGAHLTKIFPAMPTADQNRAGTTSSHAKTGSVRNNMHKRTTPPPAATVQPANEMNTARSVTGAPQRASGLPLFHAGSPPEDLDYSLRGFMNADPEQDSNVIFARIAVKEGCVTKGHTPHALTLRRRAPRNEEDPASDAARGGSEVESMTL